MTRAELSTSELCTPVCTQKRNFVAGRSSECHSRWTRGPDVGSANESRAKNTNGKRTNCHHGGNHIAQVVSLHKLFRCKRHFPPAALPSVAAALRAVVLLADERVAAVVAVVVPRRARARRAARLARRAPDAELLRWRGARSQPWLTQKAGRGRTVTSSSFSTPFTTVFCTLLGLRSNGRQ